MTDFQQTRFQTKSENLCNSIRDTSVTSINPSSSLWIVAGDLLCITSFYENVVFQFEKKELFNDWQLLFSCSCLVWRDHEIQI